MTRRMKDVNHTHPDHHAATARVYRRGPDTVVADGGRRAAETREEEARDPDEDEEQRMKDISHTPSHGDGAERVWDGTRVRPRDRDDDE